MSTTVGSRWEAPPLPCADGVSNLGSPGGRQIEGFRLPPLRRGMRTTLVNGVLILNEVETSPRHHVQRRANSGVPPAGGHRQEECKGAGGGSGARLSARIEET